MPQTHDLIQGTEAWCQFRLQHDGASEAAAMLGLSLTTTRSELLRMKHTGIAKEFGRWVQENILDHGHAVEAAARPHVERLIGEDLFPVTMSEGRMSASCDGLTMDDRIAFEHKQLNARLVALLQAGTMPEEHMPQCQQILLVTKAEKLIFVVSDGTADNLHYLWVYPDPAWFARLRAGWDQFHADLASYELPAAAAPAPIGRTPDNLPALRLEVTGAVTASNLAEYREHASAVFASINRELVTDQQFADAEKTVKWCSDVESRLAAAKQHALSQTASIDELFRTIDAISAEARSTRLDLDKLVKARKEQVRGEIVAGGISALRQHVEGLNTRLGKHYMPAAASAADFAGAIKGKKSVSSMQDAVDTVLANAKIAANETADRIQANLTSLREKASQHTFLFADAPQLVLKANDDLLAIIQTRISAHQAAEAARIEAERERIRKEEAEKLARAQEEEDEQIASIWAAARRIEGPRVGYVQKAICRFESGAGTFADDPRPRVAAAVVAARVEMQDKLRLAEEHEANEHEAWQSSQRLEQQERERQAEIEQARKDQALPAPLLNDLSSVATHVRDTGVAELGARQAIAAAQAAGPVPASAPADDGPANLLIGGINERLGYVVNAVFLKQLGFEPARIDGARRFYRDSDLPRIGLAIAEHTLRVTQLQTA